MPIFGAIIGLFSSIFSGISSLRTEQADVIKTTTSGILDVIKQADQSDAAKIAAHNALLQADSQSESWLTRTWRPMIIWSMSIIFFMYLFGFTPVNLTPDVLNRFLDIMQYSIIGFGGFRTGEKIVDSVMKQVNIGKVVQAFIDKKL